MSARPGCHARQESDELVCVGCGLRWDARDPEPPACGRAAAAPARPRGTPFVGGQYLGDPEPAAAAVAPQVLEVPVDLPSDLAYSMATAYEAARGRIATDGGKVRESGTAEAMRAAWRVMLDRVGA